MSIRKLHFAPTKRGGWIIRLDGRKAGEIVRKRGRRCYGNFLGADVDAMLVLEVFDYKIRRGATRAEQAAVLGRCYSLNRQAFLDLRQAA